MTEVYVACEVGRQAETWRPSLFLPACMMQVRPTPDGLRRPGRAVPNHPPMRIVGIALLALLGLAAVGACTGSGGTGRAMPPPDRNVLTRDEIMSSNARQGALYHAIRSLRPNFFMTPSSVHSRGSTASSPLAVYIGRLRQAGVESLRTISATSVALVRYLDPTTSQNEFGQMASGGALVITLIDPAKLRDPIGDR